MHTFIIGQYLMNMRFVIRNRDCNVLYHASNLCFFDLFGTIVLLTVVFEVDVCELLWSFEVLIN